MMRLLTLKLLARGVNGWESPTLEFGRQLTSLIAPNGSGKTPIVQAITFSLGFDTKFRDDIRERCAAVVLTFMHGSAEITIRRDIASDFHATITAGDHARDFFGEGDF
jgi:predicted ATP-binding protein involved in virulence